MAREVAEQPAALARTLDALRPQRGELAALAEGRRAVLFLARGSSDNAAVYGQKNTPAESLLTNATLYKNFSHVRPNVEESTRAGCVEEQGRPRRRPLQSDGRPRDPDEERHSGDAVATGEREAT